jgi:hypothetical protein
VAFARLEEAANEDALEYAIDQWKALEPSHSSTRLESVSAVLAHEDRPPL